jgi:hypothetical protein
MNSRGIGVFKNAASEDLTILSGIAGTGVVTGSFFLPVFFKGLMGNKCIPRNVETEFWRPTNDKKIFLS